MTRFRAKREHVKRFQRLLHESQGQTPTLNVLRVPDSLDGGWRGYPSATREGLAWAVQTAGHRSRSRTRMDHVNRDHGGLLVTRTRSAQRGGDCTEQEHNLMNLQPTHEPAC